MNRFRLSTKLSMEAYKLYGNKQYLRARDVSLLALKVNPHDFFALFTLASFYNQFAKYQQALECLKKIEASTHPNARIFLEISKTYFWLGEYESAKNYCRKVSEFNKHETDQSQEAYTVSCFELEKHLSNIKELEVLCGDLNQVLECIQMIPEGKKETYAKTLAVIALAEYWKGNYERSVNLNLCSLKLCENADTFQCLSLGYLGLGEFSKAEKYALKSIEISSDDYHKTIAGIACLKNKNFQKGWELFEYRYSRLDKDEKYKVLNRNKEWKGESLKSKTILICIEEGFGDSIQNARYLTNLRKYQAKKVIFASRPEIKEVFECNFPEIEFITLEELEKGIFFDYYFSMSSFSKLFDIDGSNIPNREGYLKAPAQDSSSITQKIQKSQKLKVGFCWEVSDYYPVSYNRRSIPIEHFKRLFDLKHIDFYSLQMGYAEKPLRAFQSEGNVHLLGRYLKSFTDTFLAVNEMDLVIAPDTSLIHVAGSLGVPNWLVLPKEQDWRWFGNQVKNPWYDSGRLFVQNKFMSWDEPMSKVKTELKKLQTEKKRQWIEQKLLTI